MMTTLSAHLDQLLSQAAPGLVFQYTSSQAAVSILMHRQIWASHVTMLNDLQEIKHAESVVRDKIDERRQRAAEGSLERALLSSMFSSIGSAARYFYVASFSAEPDLLSQWRSYCPVGGGYAIGIPTSQLANIARSRDFLFGPCVYEWSDHRRIAEQMVASFVEQRVALDPQDGPAMAHAGWEFAQHVARYGLLLKHPSWREEREWRLISPSMMVSSDVDFRATPTRIVPYYKFPLQTDDHPNFFGEAPANLTVTIGPNSDNNATSMALSLMLEKMFGREHVVGKHVSEIPFRAW